MRQLLLRRFETSDQGTFGTLQGWYTGELPDRANLSQLSCIPAGTYKCLKTFSSHFKRHMYLVGPVPNRQGIRIHSANYMGNVEKGYKSQLYGCIAIAKRFVIMDGQKAIQASAVSEFEQEMENEPFLLEIRNEYP